MRRALLVLLLVLVPAGPAAAADRCAKKGTTTRASAAQVRVYEAGDVTIGCHRRSGRKTLLSARTVETGRPKLVHAAGRYAVLDNGFGFDRGNSDARGSITVWDVARGREVARWELFVANLPGDPAHMPRLRRLLVTPAGNAAFSIDDRTKDLWAVHTLRRGGRHERLDEGADVVPISLRARPRGIVWFRGGERRTAPLP